ncbi:MAG: DUF4352 domain-containing protein [Flintibacter sp.]|uniref:DUF4352 domain-containing protein n=1 Tax=Flintibacter sp. TaxID=1918624 RepID=UPI002D8040D6|nr:DUF4352 domain-containing protein [Flintibacter sp.]MCI7158450.1 DUF4352 domain-containing protein [Flintibacter sp.]
MSNKMVSCKVCGEQIAKSAKVCPHCGAKRKRHTALGITLTILGVLLIAGAVGSKGGSPAGSDGPQTTDDSVFGVGEPVEMDNIVVTLESVTENSGGNYMTPTDGKVFVVCEFTIDNQSEQDIAVSSMLSFNAYIDDYASPLNLSSMLSTNQTQLDGTIVAGKKMNGVVGYEADPGWQNIEIRFTADFWSDQEFVFAYSK